MEILLLTNVFSFSLPELLTWRVHIGVSIGDFQSSHMRSNRIHATRTIIFNMKLISDLKLGDKVFIINKSDCTFDIAEVVELLGTIIKLQCYLNNCTFYLWKYQESKHDTTYKIIFTDENKAIEEFKFILNHN